MLGLQEIRMVGVDHTHAALSFRERCSFTRQTAEACMRRAVTSYGAGGCIILSTCNRTELWLSGPGPDPLALLCALKGAASIDDPRLIRRSGREAARHLLRTAAGLESRVFGEDQIISQVRQALALARACKTAGGALDRLFQTAVTAAKQVKTTVRLSARDCSAASRVVDVLLRECEDLSGLPCLLIGNGEMGRLTARLLLAQGCKVSMTRRTYPSRHSDQGAVARQTQPPPPPGCKVVPYEDRLTALEQATVVVSATSSPHETLSYDETLPHLDGRRRWLFDLAVPRDISAHLGTAPGVTLYDIDSMEGVAARNETAVLQAELLLDQALAGFEDWLAFQPLSSTVTHTGELAAADLLARLEGSFSSLGLSADQQQALREAVGHSAEQVTKKLLYSLRDCLPQENWQPCLEELERTAARVPPQYRFSSKQHTPKAAAWQKPPAEARLQPWPSQEKEGESA